MLSIDGLVTGLDTTTIIEGLLTIQQNKIDQLSSRKSELTVEQSAFKGIEAQLLSLRSAAGAITRSTSSVFQSKIATTNDETVLQAAASSNATAGIYTLTISQLAKPHQIASQGFSSEDAAITEGTLAVRVGSGEEATITIDSTNNTLQGLADALNDSDTGVSASIINQGTGGNAYRLLITSDKTGLSGAITITNNLAASSGSQVKPTFDGDPVQAASNAQIVLGSGAGAVTVESETNQVDDLIEGVTLQLLSADSNTQQTVSISQDTGPATEAVSEFVDTFNSVMEFIDDQSSFDSATETGGVLLGSRTAITIQDQLRDTVVGSVAGLEGDFTRLSAIGISVSDKGRLVLNSSQLQDALNSDSGNGAVAVRRLFGLDGQSDHPGIRFVGGSVRTNTGSLQVDVTQAAERASVLAPSTLSETTVIDSSNNKLVVQVDGKKSAELTLASGSYTRQQLADHVETVINSSDELSGRQVTVSLSSDALKLTSESYGTSSEITIVEGSSLATLGFAGAETDIGQDVAGTFIVDGVTETAKGSGRLLTGDADNANTGDLQLSVTLAGAQVVSGAEGTVTVTRGIAAQLDQQLNSILDSTDGLLKTTSDGIDSRIESIDESVEQLNELFEVRRQALLREFASLELIIGELQTTGGILASQLGALPAIGAAV